MSIEIILILIILTVAILLFATGWIRMDLTALFVLGALALTNLVTPIQALSGFSNPAVVTVWAMFILSAGLAKTGLSSLIGTQLLKLAGKSEGRLIAILMIVSALLSSFMNNIGVAALFLPITLEIAQRTNRPPSRLLLPMAYGALHGGLIMLIGTPSNLIVRDTLREAQLIPFGFFDFSPIGLAILVISVIYMMIIGRRFLPLRKTPRSLTFDEIDNGKTNQEQYALQERLATLVLPEDSPLIGKSLMESRIGRALELTVLSIQRKNGERVRAKTNTVLEGGDQLLVLGRMDHINEVCQSPIFLVEDTQLTIRSLRHEELGLGEIIVSSDSPFAGKSISEIDLRKKYYVNVLGVRQGELIRRTNLQNLKLKPGDHLLVQRLVSNSEAFASQKHFRKLRLEDAKKYYLDERLLTIKIPEKSALVGQTLEEARLGAAYGITVLKILRNENEWYLPTPDIHLQAGDSLVVEGHPLDLEILRGLKSCKIERQIDIDMDDLTFGPIQIVEVMLSPYSTMAGKNLRELRFREKFHVSVLALWRGERAFRSELGTLPLQHGDAMLCYGTLENLKALARERDFIVLKMDLQEKPRVKKAPIATLIMMAVILTTILLGVPIEITAIAGCTLMVLSGALTMDEAYQSIDWRSIFVIAGMLPMGIAIQQTGVAAMASSFTINLIGAYGYTAILTALMVLCMAATLIMPSKVVAVIMAPIALNMALDLGISPYAFLMGVAYALAASFISPVATPVNTLVMSPGSYRYSDFLKNGMPISLIVLIMSVILLPFIFPY
jgi:di/tricarboxylate transporter